MNIHNIVVLSIDRLGASWLGPYGGAYLQTPQFNRLAAQSTVVENFLADSWKLKSILRGYWEGLPAFCDGTALWPNLAKLATERGYKTQLVSDDVDVLDHPLASGFEEQVQYEVGETRRAAKSIETTCLAKLFDLAAKQIANLSKSTLTWIHGGSLNRVWDAPYELRLQHVGEDEPDPPEFVAAPSLKLALNDPDELLGYMAAMSAQVEVLDTLIGQFIERVDVSLGVEKTLLVVTSPRGYPLGEHGAIGAHGDSLRGEVLQVPLIIRWPHAEHRLVRLQGLFQPHDLFVTLAATLGAESRGWGTDLQAVMADRTMAPGWALAREDGEAALRTPSWFFRSIREEDAHRRQLYAKPDDRHEANEVSSRAASVVEACQGFTERLAGDLHLQTRPVIAFPDDIL